MSIDALFQDIDERVEAGVIFDADSIAYTSCYKYKEKGTIEDIYIDFWQQIKTIEMEIWKRHIIKEVVISLSSSKNFRHKLYPDYKGNRKNKDKEAQALSDRVSELKRLIYERCNSEIL